MDLAQTDTAKRYYALPDLSKFFLGDNQILVYSPLTKDAQIVNTQVNYIFKNCLKSATLDEHAAVLMEEFNLPAARAAAVHEQLALCIKHGWLVADDEIKTPMQQLPLPEETVPPITWLGIPTKNRPESLLSCVESFARCCVKFEKKVKFLISDQSDLKEHVDANLEILKRLTGTYGIEIFYIGLDEHKELARQLAQRGGFDQSTVDFALLNDNNLPSGIGCNRNALLLCTVGEMLMMCDDDAVCVLGPAPDQEAGLQLTSKTDPTEFWYYTEADMEEQHRKLEVLDIFEKHEQLVGKKARTCIEESRGPISCGRSAGNLFRRESYGITRVLVTMMGMLGESGMSGLPTPFLRAEDLSRERLMSSEQTYRKAMTTHLIARAVTKNTITEGGFCMGLNLGLDNRDLLPPFLPVMRNEDGVFGALATSLFNANLAFLPWTLHHKAFGHRYYPEENIPLLANELRAGGILAVLFGSFKPGLHHRNSRENLIACGDMNAETAKLSPADFEEFMSIVMWRYRARFSTNFEQLLSKNKNQPSFWANDVKKVMTETRASMTKKTFAVPEDLLALGEERALETMQTIVRRFSELLQIWPGVVDAAKELRRSEVQIAKRI